MSGLTDPPEDSAARLYREFHNSPTERFAREMANSSAAQLAREMAGSSTVKLAQEIANSPEAKLARGMSESPTTKVRDIALCQTADRTNVMMAAKMLGDLKPIMINPSVAEAFTGFKPIQIDSSLAETFAQIKPMEIAPGLAQAISEAQKALSDFGKPYGGLAKAVSAIEEQHRGFQKSLVASLGGSIGDVARMNQWASAFSGIEFPDIKKLYPTLPNVASEIARLHESMAKSLAGSVAVDRQQVSAMLGLSQGISAGLDATRFKMSAFAGVTDMLGTHTRAWDEAYRSLFGEWRTRPDLPGSYWRDRRTRRRMYDAAEVDPGLAGLNLGVAVEVVVESGLASGARSEANAVAVISFGDVSMTIRSRGTRNDAYKVLERFEEELRTYITRKLSDKFGAEWFKERIDGNVAGDAKRIRKQALERGETSMPLINYTELGHLSSIVLGTKNWDEVFGDIFVHRGEFDIDMQKLIAARRPTMHIRPIDGVRLVEMICVVQRLSRQMEDDGAWKVAAESEQ